MLYAAKDKLRQTIKPLAKMIRGKEREREREREREGAEGATKKFKILYCLRIRAVPGSSKNLSAKVYPSWTRKFITSLFIYFFLIITFPHISSQSSSEIYSFVFDLHASVYYLRFYSPELPILTWESLDFLLFLA